MGLFVLRHYPRLCLVISTAWLTFAAACSVYTGDLSQQRRDASSAAGAGGSGATGGTGETGGSGASGGSSAGDGGTSGGGPVDAAVDQDVDVRDGARLTDVRSEGAID